MAAHPLPLHIAYLLPDCTLRFPLLSDIVWCGDLLSCFCLYTHFWWTAKTWDGSRPELQEKYELGFTKTCLFKVKEVRLSGLLKKGYFCDSNMARGFLVWGDPEGGWDVASLREEKGFILCVDTPRAAKWDGPREPSSVMEMSCILIWQWFSWVHVVVFRELFIKRNKFYCMVISLF